MQIRNEISYILAKSSILKFERKYNEALQLMKDALQSSHKSTLCDRLESTNVELFLMFEMVDIHLLNNNTVFINTLIYLIIHSKKIFHSRLKQEKL